LAAGPEPTRIQMAIVLAKGPTTNSESRLSGLTPDKNRRAQAAITDH